MPRLFLITDEKKKISTGDEYDIKYVVSGDENTEMSIQKFLRDGNFLAKDDIFVSFIHPTPFDVRINTPDIPRENLVIVSNRKEIKSALISLEERAKDDYDFFSGGELESEDENVRKTIQKYMRELKNLTHVFIDAGYNDKSRDESSRKISDWMVTFYDPLQELFVRYCQPEVSADDMFVEDEFRDNPAFRTGITQYFMKVIANFMVNNDLVSIEEIGAMGDSKGWVDPEVWEELKEIEINL